MNCCDCKEKMAAMVDGLLDQAENEAMASHLAACESCLDEMADVKQIHNRLAADGRVISSGSIETQVMDRIISAQARELRKLKMIKRFKTIGIGSLAAACLVLIIGLLMTGPDNRALAAETMAKGVKAVGDLETIHIKCMMRTRSGDNFSNINLRGGLVPVELWKEFTGQRRWRIKKPNRYLVMDGKSTVMIMGDDSGVKVDKPTRHAFDTYWFHDLAGVAETLSDDLDSALAGGNKMTLTQEIDADGSSKRVVTVETKSGLSDDDYLKNKFFSDADTKRIYRFDAETNLLESLKVYAHTTKGDILILKTTKIDYNTDIDPSVFVIDVPKNVRWHIDPKPLADNEKYEKMTPDQAARTFFQACADEDWEEARKFQVIDFADRTKASLGGLKIISIGEPFQSGGYPGWFVPYEIKPKFGRLRKHNLALKKHPKSRRFFVDGGL